MKSFTRNALLAMAGLIVLSLPAHAAGTTAVVDTPTIRMPTKHMQLVQRPYDPSAGSVGFRNENPGGVGFKKSKKKKKKAKK